MQAGKLRDRIEIQRRTTARDSFGDAAASWQTVATRWGAVEPLSGAEGMYAAQQSPDVNVRVRLRYYAGLTPTDRLKKGDRVFNVISVRNPDERRRETVCDCREVEASRAL